VNKVLRLATLADNLSHVLVTGTDRQRAISGKARLFLLERNLDSARIYAVRSIDIFSSTRDFVDLARTHYHLGDTYGMER